MKLKKVPTPSKYDTKKTKLKIRIKKLEQEGEVRIDYHIIKEKAIKKTKELISVVKNVKNTVHIVHQISAMPPSVPAVHEIEVVGVFRYVTEPGYGDEGYAIAVRVFLHDAGFMAYKIIENPSAELRRAICAKLYLQKRNRTKLFDMKESIAIEIFALLFFRGLSYPSINANVTWYFLCVVRFLRDWLYITVSE